MRRDCEALTGRDAIGRHRASVFAPSIFAPWIATRTQSQSLRRVI
jgi:hypothetical protein